MFATLPADSPSRPSPRVRAGLAVSTFALLTGCGSAEPAQLPDLAGRALDDARATATAAGFSTLSSRDLLRARSQAVASDWRVCTQTPPPGRADPGVAVEFGVVRTDERCPGEDAGLPRLVGKALPAAEDATHEAGFVRFTSHDATGEGRVPAGQGWTVCSHTPAAGTTDREATVDVGVVRTAEPCPGQASATTSSTPTTTASPRPAPKPAPKPQPKPNPQRADESDDSDGGSGSGSDERAARPDPDPPSKPRSGQSGHPCLPGERDGDGDGFCGEGR